MSIELSDDERRLLLELLEKEFGQLKAEINRTETTGFKDELKEREHRLAAIIGRLQEARPAA